MNLNLFWQKLFAFIWFGPWASRLNYMMELRLYLFQNLIRSFCDIRTWDLSSLSAYAWPTQGCRRTPESSSLWPIRWTSAEHSVEVLQEYCLGLRSLKGYLPPIWNWLSSIPQDQRSSATPVQTWLPVRASCGRIGASRKTSCCQLLSSHY